MSNNIKSHWGVELSPNFVEQGSDTLAIILPGIAYTLDRVTLEYASELALKLGYDVARIEYGFQKSRKGFDVPTEFDIAANETLAQVKSILKPSYKKIIIIAKSIGTCVQNVINKNLKEFDVTNVCISPINKTVEMGIDKNALIITGSSDPLLSKENIESLTASYGHNLINFKRANHSLNIEKEPVKSLEIQIDVINIIEKFIK